MQSQWGINEKNTLKCDILKNYYFRRRPSWILGCQSESSPWDFGAFMDLEYGGSKEQSLKKSAFYIFFQAKP